MRKSLLIALLLFVQHTLRAQTDRVFWFAVPEVSNMIANGGPFDRPIHLRLTAGNSTATVTVSIPANPSITPITQTIAAGATQTINLTPWIDQLETKPANTVLNHGLLITSTESITAYYDLLTSCGSCNPEIFILKGNNALGNNFFIPLQNLGYNSQIYSPIPTNSFDIIATEDNTTVQITPTRAIVGHAANVMFSVVLNRGQTYSATATGFSAADHLTGSKVVSDKPIAITMKDDLVTVPHGGCADLGGDQIIPVSKTGTTYVAVRGFLYSPFDRLFIVATRDATVVTIDGIAVATLNAGASYMHTLSANTAYITSSAPIYVSQLSGNGCEIGLSTLPPVECTGSQSVSFVRSVNDPLYLSLLVPAGAEGNFTLNGSATAITAADFTTVPFSGGQWMYARKLISTATVSAGNVMKLENLQGLFHVGIVSGSEVWGSRFGFFSDFNTLRVDATALPTACRNRDIQLNAASVTGATYSWTGPASFSSPQQNPVISNAGPQHAGRYYVNVNYRGCTAIDSVDIAFSELPIVTLQDTIRNCHASVTLDAGAGFSSYQWSTGATTSSITATTTGKYYVTVTNAGGCSTLDSVYVEMITINVTAQSADPTLCTGEDINLAAASVAGATYQWAGPAGFSSSQQNPVISAALPGQAGNYTVTASYNGCINQATVPITITALPEAAISDTLRNCGDPLILDAGAGFSSYQWSTGATTSSITVTLPGKYFISISNAAGCHNLDSVMVEMHPADIQLQPGSSLLCDGGTVTLQANGASSYQWYQGSSAIPGATANQYIVDEPANYSVMGENAFGCTDTENITVNLRSKPSLAGSPDHAICAGDQVSLQVLQGQNYSWSPATYLDNPSIANPIATPLQSIEYIAHVTDVVCNYDTNIVVRVVVNPLPAVTASRSNDIDCSHALAQLMASGGTQYTWSPATGLSDPTASNPTITSIATTTTYTVTAIDAMGCESSASVTVNVNNTGGEPTLYIPSAFTPNGDGKNDCFKVAGTFHGELLGFSIFNRWGERIFYTTNPTDCWDGTWKGIRQDSGVFIYMVRAKTTCGEVFSKGHITIIR